MSSKSTHIACVFFFTVYPLFARLVAVFISFPASKKGSAISHAISFAPIIKIV